MGEAYYEPQRVLVTGGCGFLGSHLILRLVKKYRVVNLDCLSYSGSKKNLESIENHVNYRFVKGNILSADLVNYVLQSEGIDTIIHLATYSHLEDTFGASFSFTETNVIGTHILLEAAKNHNIKRFLHMSTDEVYGERSCGEIEKVYLPLNPFAATNVAAEFLSKAFYRSFHTPIIVVRGSNVYGSQQFPEKIIPKFICLLLRGEKCCLHGTGTNVRSYVYIDDAIDAIELLLHHGTPGVSYDIATTNQYSNLHIAETLVHLIYPGVAPTQLITFVQDRPVSDRRFAVICPHLQKLGWRPRTDFVEGLRKTIVWYKGVYCNEYWPNYDWTLKPHPLPPIVETKFFHSKL